VHIDLFAASEASKGFGFGIVLTALWLGFQHGVDWDHIAAITDITSSQEERRESLLFGTLYVLGHALVVILLGGLAVIAGEHLPAGIDTVMERVVGVTLLLLGIYVFYSLIRHGRDFRLRSRWMLVFAGVRRGMRWLRRRAGSGNGDRGGATAVATAEGEADPSLWHHGHHGRPGHHHHAHPEPDDEMYQNYSRTTAFGVGMIHGIGAETGTQVALILGAATVANKTAGVAVLFAFVLGLILSNSLITVGTAFGFLRASRNFAIYATVGVIAGVFSLVIGTIFVAGWTSVLPHSGHFFGG
jgi:high-affinity nickel permease